VIIDLEQFITEERPRWNELERLLEHLANNATYRFNVASARRFHYLYQRASSDLVKLDTYGAEPELLHYLESLVARAYGEIHETRKRPHRLAVWHWFRNALPQAFRRHAGAFYLSLAVTMLGCTIGSVLVLNPEAKKTLLPYAHLQIDPAERIAAEREMYEEADTEGHDPLAGAKARGTAFYIINNTRVSFMTLALGMTWGIGTVAVLFGNGVLLGAVCMDYVRAGEGIFLTGWLLPHGATEIPAILIAGQAGFMLAGALIGWGTRDPLRERMRAIGPDVVTLIGCVTILLIWAGFVEAYLSQYHFVVPFWLKIGFGMLELFLLFLYLFFAGRADEGQEDETPVRAARKAEPT
jgi:uncharacterized membrane protein SpoIIM required for sporulation